MSRRSTMAARTCRSGCAVGVHALYLAREKLNGIALASTVVEHRMRSAFAFYPTKRAGRDMRCYDEMRHHDETVRPHYARLERWLVQQGGDAIARKRAEA